MKRCSRCKRLLDESKFGADKTRKDGLSYWCKACKRANSIAWEAKNREHVNELARRQYQKNLEVNRRVINERKKKWYHQNAGRERAKAKVYYWKNRERILARNCVTRAKHWAANRYTAIKSRVRKQDISLMPREAFVAWFDQQEKVCAYCKRRLIKSKNMEGLTVDRKDASKGYIEDNIVLACRRCNTVKGFWFTYQDMLEIAKKYF